MKFHLVGQLRKVLERFKTTPKVIKEDVNTTIKEYNVISYAKYALNSPRNRKSMLLWTWKF